MRIPHWPARSLRRFRPARRAGLSEDGGLATLITFRRRASSTSWKRLVSEAEGLSRSAARLRRRAHSPSKDGRLSTPFGRVLDSPSAPEVFASMRSAARWVGRLVTASHGRSPSTALKRGSPPPLRRGGSLRSLRSSFFDSRVMPSAAQSHYAPSSPAQRGGEPRAARWRGPLSARWRGPGFDPSPSPCADDRVDDIVEGAHDLARRDAHDRDALRAQPCVTTKVALRPIAHVMTDPVDLDGKPRRARNKNRSHRVRLDADGGRSAPPARAPAAGSTAALPAAIDCGAAAGRWRRSLSALAWALPPPPR